MADVVSGDDTLPAVFEKFLQYIDYNTLLLVIMGVFLLSVMVIIISIAVDKEWTIISLGLAVTVIAVFTLPFVSLGGGLAIIIGLAMGMLFAYLKYVYLTKKHGEMFKNSFVQENKSLLGMSALILLLLVVIVL